MAILNWVAHAAPRHETSIRLLSVSSSENTRSTIIFCMNSHTISRRMDPSYIQNKCSITSLLTEGGPKTKCDPLKLLEDIQYVKACLIHSLELFEAECGLVYSSLHEEVTRAMERFMEIQLQDPDMIRKNIQSFREVDSLAQEVQLLLNEESYIRNQADGFFKDMGSHTTKLHFNVITQDMMSETGTVVGKRKRLEKTKVAVLERWYEKHSLKPYLSELALLSLMSQTGLSKSQIRNWISNKRRKERGDLVSTELSDLLEDQLST